MPGCPGVSPGSLPQPPTPPAQAQGREGSSALAEWDFSAVNRSRLFYSTSCEVYLSLPDACSTVFVSQIVPVAIWRKL